MIELSELGLIGLFVSTFLGSTILPAAGLPLMVFLIYKNIDPVSIIVIATIGNFLGAVVTYLLGHKLNNIWLHRFFKIDPTKVASVEKFVHKYHSMAALGCGLPVIGDRISLALGMFRPPMMRTLSYMFLGKIIRYVVLIAIISFGFYKG